MNLGVRLACAAVLAALAAAPVAAALAEGPLSASAARSSAPLFAAPMTAVGRTRLIALRDDDGGASARNRREGARASGRIAAAAPPVFESKAQTASALLALFAATCGLAYLNRARRFA